MAWDVIAAAAPQQPQRKGRLQQLSIRILLILTVISILIVIYILISSTTGSIWYVSSPSISVTTKPRTDIHKEVVEELEHEERVPVAEQEQESMDDASRIISSSSCIWDPRNSNEYCKDLLFEHMSTSLNRSRALFLSRKESYENLSHNQSVTSVLHRRWLLLGDSTVFRLFAQLRQYLMIESVERYSTYRASYQCNDHNSNDFHCTNVKAGRCDTMENFYLPRLPNTEQWRLPNFALGEGPIKFGYKHSYCTDCDGCDSHVLSCTIASYDILQRCENSDSIESYFGPSYSGYLSVEFARDVELQTLEYKTTQENLVSNYIGNQWNKPVERILEFGRPICVVSTGHHDVAIPNITLDVYLQNVQWYLELLVEECDYVIWIGNNCPATDTYYQTISGTYEWNIGVRDMLFLWEKNRSIRSNVFYLDVYNASKIFEHEDNIHMSVAWYKLLALCLQDLMQNLRL